MEVVIMNPGLSAGQKVGLVASFVLFCLIAWVIYTIGAPKK